MTRDEFTHNLKNISQMLPAIRQKLSGDFDGFCVEKIDKMVAMLDWSFIIIDENKLFDEVKDE